MTSFVDVNIGIVACTMNTTDTYPIKIKKVIHMIAELLEFSTDNVDLPI